jgi:hypothetical protein
MPTLPEGYPRWADDDDDGTLDTFNTASVVGRLTGNAPPAHQMELTIRSRPLTGGAQVSSDASTRAEQPHSPSPTEVNSTQGKSDPRAPPSSKGQRARGRRGKGGNTQGGGVGATPATSSRTTANGVPLLPSSSVSTGTSRSHIDPAIWNAFAGEISAPAASPAARVFERVQREQREASSEAAVDAPNKKQQKRRK